MREPTTVYHFGLHVPENRSFINGPADTIRKRLEAKEGSLKVGLMIEGPYEPLIAESIKSLFESGLPLYFSILNTLVFSAFFNKYGYEPDNNSTPEKLGEIVSEVVNQNRFILDLAAEIDKVVANFKDRIDIVVEIETAEDFEFEFPDLSREMIELFFDTNNAVARYKSKLQSRINTFIKRNRVMLDGVKTLAEECELVIPVSGGIHSSILRDLSDCSINIHRHYDCFPSRHLFHPMDALARKKDIGNDVLDTDYALGLLTETIITVLQIHYNDSFASYDELQRTAIRIGRKFRIKESFWNGIQIKTPDGQDITVFSVNNKSAITTFANYIGREFLER